MFGKDRTDASHFSQNMPIIAVLFVLGVSLCFTGHTALAQESDKDDFKWPQKTLATYDTHGLEQKARPYALTPAIDLNMSHAWARQLINILPKAYRSAPLRNLVISALTARINGTSITGRKKVPVGADLLTLRIKTLNAMGAYKPAFQLYTALDADIAHPHLLKGAIRAQLGLGRHTLACLEAKAGLDSLASSNTTSIDRQAPFWTQMQKFCRPVIGQPLFASEPHASSGDPEPLIEWKKKADRPRTWSDLTSYSMPQIAAIMRNHVVRLAKLAGSPADLPPKQSAMLSHIAKGPPELRYKLISSAARRHLVTPERWRTFLKDMHDRIQDEKGQNKRAGLPESMNRLLILARQYRAQKRGESTAPAAELAEIFTRLHDDVPVSALLAFEPLLKTPPEKPPRLTTRNTVMSVYLRVNRYFAPEAWGVGRTPINNAAQAKEEDQAQTRQFILLALFALRNQDFSERATKYMIACRRQTACPRPEYGFLQDFKAFIDELNIGLAKSIKPDKIYDNKKGLTYRSRYVIPSYSLRKRIKEKKLEKRLGKAIFLSTLALHREDNNKLEPYFTASVLKKLSDSGLTRFGRDFAIAYLIGK